MRILFMGTPAFAIPVLEALLESGHPVVGVVTQPDKPAGRGQLLQEPPTKEFARAHGIPVLQPPSLRKSPGLDQVKTVAPDLIVVAGYGRILPPEALAVPLKGCLNIHPSLLPRHRGPSPVATALLEADVVTGVSIIVMDAGMDTGPLVAQRQEPVLPEDTAETLTERLFRRGAHLLRETLPGYLAGETLPRPQPEEGATYTRLLSKEDGELDWRQGAEALARRLRAFTPWPGCYTRWKGKLLKVLEARVVGEAIPGAAGLVVRLPDPAAPVGVVTGRGALALVRVQLEGRLPADAAEFLRGHRDLVGVTLPS